MAASEGNIVLVGMPGVGKSTAGVLLAKALSRAFVDTDLLIQSHECRRLQDIIDEIGVERFRALEERYVLTFECRETVVATGGSVIYSEPAITHLRRGGVVVYLELPYADLVRRVRNLDDRGVVRGPGQSFEALYEERRPLYEAAADVTVACAGLDHEGVVAAALQAIGRVA